MISSRKFQVTTLPDFSKFIEGRPAKALVLPGAFYADGVRLMAASGFQKAEGVEDADVVVFMGGSDLDPATYGEEAIPETSGAKHRDDAERVVYDMAQAAGKVCFGICRGAQFLHAMNGGKLWQHVQGHGGSVHEIYDLDSDVTVLANSIHHQMLQDHKDLEVVAVCSEQVSKVFKAHGLTVDLNREGSNMAEMEIEAGAYNKTKCFFVQGHPEVSGGEFTAWTMHKLMDYMTDWQGKFITRDNHNQLSVNEQLNMWRERGQFWS